MDRWNKWRQGGQASHARVGELLSRMRELNSQRV